MRAGGEKRGNNKDRARRKHWMLWAHDKDLDFDKCRCAHCSKELNYKSVTADRIIAGGSYKRENIQPSCLPCNQKRFWEEKEYLIETKCENYDENEEIPF